MSWRITEILYQNSNNNNKTYSNILISGGMILARMPGCYFSWVLEYEEFLAKKTGKNSPGYTGYKGKIHAESGRGQGIKETR